MHQTLVHFCLITLILTPLSDCLAQEPASEINAMHSPEKVDFRPSIRANNLILSDEVESYLNMMDSVDRVNRKPMGYRIQIYSSSGANGHKDALKNESEFLGLYKETTSYTNWSYPNWVVRIGDFRNQLEALEFHNELREKYPASFIVKDEISTDYAN